MADSAVEISQVCAEPSQIGINYDELDVSIPCLRDIVEARRHKLAEQKREKELAIEEAKMKERLQEEAEAKIRAERMVGWLTDYMLMVLNRWHEDVKLRESLISHFVEGVDCKLLESAILKDSRQVQTTLFGEESQNNHLTWGHIADYLADHNIISIINDRTSPYYGCALLFECKEIEPSRSRYDYPNDRYMDVFDIEIGIKLLMGDHPYATECEVPGYVKYETDPEVKSKLGLQQCCIVM